MDDETQLADLRRIACLVDPYPADLRLWSLTLPPWWTDTSTVAKRRALTGSARERLLRMRAA